jgi:hypothetical protein
VVEVEMVKRSASLPRALDERLLRQVAAAARAVGRSRGRARVRAMCHYIDALQNFTDRAIEHLEINAARQRS